MNFELPVIPAGIVLLLSFFSPYAVAIVNHPRWTAGSKKLITIVVTLVLAGVAMAFYYLTTGEQLLPWPAFILLFLVVSQAAYALVLKPSAKAIERNVGITEHP